MTSRLPSAIRRLVALGFALLLSARSLHGESALPAGVQDLKIGQTAPDFALPGIDGQTHHLADYAAARVLMVVFLSNHCPDSHAAEARIKKLVDDCKGQSFAIVAINPNNPDSLRPDELGYSKYNDGFDDMKKYAAEQGFNFPYLYDGENQAVAKAYGCLATPHVFIFDAARTLRYKGQFDDSRYADPATVKSQDARRAVEALLAGGEVPVTVTKPHGCSTKWLEKKASVAAAESSATPTPVEVETIDAAGVAKLRRNGTPKLRLFNVWATWCGPCVAEFPELVKIMQRFSRRPFELITISTDDPASVPQVKTFLEKKGAGLPDKVRTALKSEGRTTNSYLFTGADVNEVMQTLDPAWPGGIPYSVLVDREGQILWRRAGAVDPDELREKILEALGRYYVPEN